MIRRALDSKPSPQPEPKSQTPDLAPPPDKIEVIDLDIQPLGTPLQMLTLIPSDGDTLNTTPDEILVHFQKTGEDLTINKAQVIWMSKRPRTITRQPELFKPEETSN